MNGYPGSHGQLLFVVGSIRSGKNPSDVKKPVRTLRIRNESKINPMAN